MTATEWAGSVSGENVPAAVAKIDVTTESVNPGTRRPAGTRFGTLVHALLAGVPLEAPAESIVRQLADAHGRVLAAEPEEVGEAADTVRRVLSHPVMLAAARAAGAGQCYRETPITWHLESGVMVEGIVDLAYITDREVIVVDFKTDREMDGAVDRYRRQVQVYAAAVGAALGCSARAVLMRI
jgi:ATP-dependent exoDNAse (exonuclease V) beta subunit